MNTEPAQPAKPIVCVEDSRAQRIQRSQARIRDRGGIFVPQNRNTLAEFLLARGVNGESPSRIHASHGRRKRSPSSSPIRQIKRPKEATARSTREKTASKGRKSMLQKEAEEFSDADSSRNPSGKCKAAPTKTVAAGKNKGKSKATASTDDRPAPKKRGRPPKKKAEDTVKTSTTKPSKPKASKSSSDKAGVALSVVVEGTRDEGEPEPGPSRPRKATRAKLKLDADSDMESVDDVLVKPQVPPKVKIGPPSKAHRRKGDDTEPQKSQPKKSQQAPRVKSEDIELPKPYSEPPDHHTTKADPPSKPKPVKRTEGQTSITSSKPARKPAAAKDAAPTGANTTNLRKKRARAPLQDVEEMDTVNDEQPEKPAKRPKRDKQRVSAKTTNVTSDDDAVESAAKLAKKRVSSRTAASKTKPTSKTLKENTVETKISSPARGRTKPASQRSKPRKSVMARVLGAASEALELDDEPDPIDFLS
ncbi:hypothetical protein HGRIS_006746 [Hohenbuehelia grisea]|uniref:Uncharacterized protein n=1 Tax=Hohenbuehelia grisea TaxID=104357 RepID=A0ABR3JA75_9AGAR